MEYPNISILTPTYNRKHFIKLAVYNIINFDYDKNKLTWEILDDGDEPFINNISNIQEILKPIKLIYKYNNSHRFTIGEKRNKLIKNAVNNTIAFMDDDDIYLSSYLKHSIETMKKNKSGLVGSAGMLFVFPFHNFKMSAIQCPAKRQIHEATMVTNKKYVRSMGGFKKNSKGEGAKMVDFNEKKCSETDISKIMVCVAHKHNTINKDMFLDKDVSYKMTEDYKKLLSHILDIEYDFVEEVDD
jgi:glycosyltransferase involved in cell wall biosynthesis